MHHPTAKAKDTPLLPSISPDKSDGENNNKSRNHIISDKEMEPDPYTTPPSPSNYQILLQSAGLALALALLYTRKKGLELW